MPSAPEIVRLKISLDDVKPTVMRRIEVPIDVKLDILRDMIQAIMPWDNTHTYEFRVREVRWAVPPPAEWDMGFPVVDSRKATLARALAEPGFKALRYTNRHNH
jgi:Plasmid pRiA4b ORF-3-like protein